MENPFYFAVILNITIHQHDKDNDKQKKELQKIRTVIKLKVIKNV